MDINHIYMLTQTGISSSYYPKVNTKIKKIRGDNPLSESLSLLQFLTISVRLAVYKRKNRITPEALEVLSVVLEKYVLHGEGCTVYYMVQKLNSTSKGEYRNVRYKLSRLVSKGFIEVYERFGNCNVYVPTRKALEELSELCK